MSLMFLSALFFNVCVVFGSICEGETCTKVLTMPLLDGMKATLKADLDVKNMNKHLSAYIRQEVVNSTEAVFANKLKSFKEDVLETVNIAIASIIQQKLKDVSPVGFLATNTMNLRNVGDGQIVIYDSVSTNLGGGYNPLSGTFTAPSSGLYFFTWTALTDSKKHFVTQLFVNKAVIARNHATAVTVSHAMSSTQSVVVNLKKNDKVMIKIHSDTLSRLFHYSSNFEIHIYGDKQSTFSGFKI